MFFLVRLARQSQVGSLVDISQPGWHARMTQAIGICGTYYKLHVAVIICGKL